MHVRRRRWIGNAFLMVGVIALSVWLWSIAATVLSQDWENWVFDREIDGRPATVAGYVAERAMQIGGQVAGWFGFPAVVERSVSVPGSIPKAPPQASLPTVIESKGLIGRLTIPRLSLTAMVREGSQDTTLRLALGHIPGTAFPGQNGNVGVAGHRDTLFRGLREIRNKDVIQFETLEGRYVYQVESTEIVKPRDVRVLHSRAHSELTLVTCYPFSYVGTAPDRFIVKARQVSENPQEKMLIETHQNSTQQADDPATTHPWPSKERPQVVNASDRSDQPMGGLEGAAHRLAGRKVRFEVSKDHSCQLAPGISFGLTGTDMYDHRVSGWMWVMPDRRTIWLRDQSVQVPVIFYGQQDGKKRELVITSITQTQVKGYLFLPEDTTSANAGKSASGTSAGVKIDH
jgi:sortase A